LPPGPRVNRPSNQGSSSASEKLIETGNLEASMKMRNISLSVAAFLMFAISVAAQEKSSTNTQKTVTGCLSGPNPEGAFVLKPSKGRAFEVGGNDQLKSHVGHTVKLTGTWAKSGAEIGENETNEKVEKHETGEKNEAEHREVAERHFKVTDIQHVSDTCSQSAVK